MFNDIYKPTLLLDKARAIKNIKKMIAHAQTSGVRFRPHFKTHQSAQIGEWFRDAGVEAITVSSVEMGWYFAQHGWRDITIAFPVNLREIERINQLAGQVKLALLVESQETVRFLAEHLTEAVEVWIKVDVGYGRTGIRWSEFDRLGSLAGQIAATERMTLCGVLTHAGHTYQARSRPEIGAIYKDMVTKLKIIKAKCATFGLEPIEISIGDTPSCSVVDYLGDVDEIRPGNFVFYDAMQLQIGSCREDEIAVGLACPIVAKHPGDDKLIIYGGAVHLSKESLTINGGPPMFGYVALPFPEGNGWGLRLAQTYVAGLSQEHGIIKTNSMVMNRLRVGDLVVILPVHSCLTVNLMRQCRSLDGEVISLGAF